MKAGRQSSTEDAVYVVRQRGPITGSVRLTVAEVSYCYCSRLTPMIARMPSRLLNRFYSALCSVRGTHGKLLALLHVLADYVCSSVMHVNFVVA